MTSLDDSRYCLYTLYNVVMSSSFAYIFSAYDGTSDFSATIYDGDTISCFFSYFFYFVGSTTGVGLFYLVFSIVFSGTKF